MIGLLPAFGSSVVAVADGVLDAHARPGEGIAAAVVAGGRVAYRRGIGLANTEMLAPLTSATPMHVASVAKQFTAFAIAILADRGAIDLDAPIGRYLAALPGWGAIISVRDLILHTHGLRDQWDLLALAGYEIQSVLRQEAILRLLRRQSGRNPNAGTFKYSNTGYTLLAAIVEQVSSLSFAGFCRDFMFGPLGMNDTLFVDDLGVNIPGRAESYDISSGPPRRLRLNFATVGATGLVTSLDDLCRWMKEVLAPAVLPAAAMTMFRGEPAPADHAGRYCFGLHHFLFAGEPAIGHAGMDAGFRAFVGMIPSHRLGVALLSNTGAPATGIASALLDVFANATSDPGPAPRDVGAWPEDVAGSYLTDDGCLLRFDCDGGHWRAVGAYGSVRNLVPIGKGAMRAAPLSSPHEPFRPSFRRILGCGGETIGLSQTGNVGEEIALARLAPPPVAYLGPCLSGNYRSDELDITYACAVEGTTLTMTSWRTGELRFELVAPLCFAGPDGVVTIGDEAAVDILSLATPLGRSIAIAFHRVLAD